MRIAHASKGESGYVHQAAGDQTGTEVCIRLWYSRPWDVVIRAKDRMLGRQIAVIAERLVSCPLIGYDQADRTSLWSECERIHWDIERLYEIHPCECDCSSLIPVICRFCGVIIPKTCWTGSLEANLMATGKFEALRDRRYLDSGDYLHKGDFLLNTKSHVATALDDGPQAAGFVVGYKARVKVSDYLNVRMGPGTAYPVIMLQGTNEDPTPYRLASGTNIYICEEKNGWGRLEDIEGWVSLSYVRR